MFSIPLVFLAIAAAENGRALVIFERGHTGKTFSPLFTFVLPLFSFQLCQKQIVTTDVYLLIFALTGSSYGGANTGSCLLSS